MSVVCSDARFGIDSELSDGEERRRRGGALGVQSYARQKLLYRKGLGHVIVCADIQPRHLVDDLIARRQYDNGRLPLLPEPPQDLYPVERRQHHVQHYQVEIPVERDGERFPAVGDDRAVVVLVLELEL